MYACTHIHTTTPTRTEIGYAQGMNDILARFLVVTDSEVDSYWLFKRYMDGKQQDFLEDTMMAKVGEWVWCHESVQMKLIHSHMHKCTHTYTHAYNTHAVCSPFPS